MSPFRYKQVMSGGKVLALIIMYCLAMVVMLSVATENYSEGML